MRRNLEDIIEDAFCITDISDENVQLYENMIYALINDLKELSKVDTVKFINNGHCSQSIRVGDYALTFGAIDDFEAEPDISFSNAILYRKEYPDEDFKIIVSLYLDLPKCKTHRNEMYHKIRDAHKRWYDVHMDNFGIVPHDFTHPFSNVPLEGLRNLGIEQCFIKNLKKGETRLIDHGYILPEQEEPPFLFDHNLIYFLESEYENTKVL